MLRTFKNLKTNQTRNLKFNPATGLVFFLNQWWDKSFLASNFSIVDQTPVEQLGPQLAPKFAPEVESDKPFENKFRVSRKKKR